MSKVSEETNLDQERLLFQKYENDIVAENDCKSLRSIKKTQKHLNQLCLSVFINIILSASGFAWIVFSQNINYHCIPHPVYSPAESAIEYKTTVFRSGLHNDITEYQGQDDIVNARWEELYNEFPASAISRDMAERLPNKTTSLPFDNTKFAVQLDVFHQLHCLNMLRKLLYPTKYVPDMSEEATYHMEHCVESLRQSLQCASDVSTIFWEWSPANQKMMGNPRTTHTCRDFEKIQQWGREHRIETDWNFLLYVPDAPIRKEG